MFALAIEASNPSAGTGGVALGKADALDTEPIGVELFQKTDRHTDDLLPAIERLCARAGVKPGEISLVGVSAGPGGYTAVRMSVAVAKMIAEASGARCICVPSAHVVAWSVTHDSSFAVALASKGESAHVTVFDAVGSETRACEIIGWDVLGSLGVDLLIADSHLPASFRDESARLGISIEPPVFAAARVLGLMSGFPPIGPADLHPIYPREPEAVRKWRELHAG